MSLRFRAVFASACALLVVLLCAWYADSVRADAEKVRSEALARYGGEIVSLVVAPEGLEAGDVVSRTNVTTSDWVAELSPKGAVTDLEAAVGRQITNPVAAGAPITELNFREQDELGEVPAGYVAVSVPVTERLGLSSSAKVGSRVVAYEALEGEARLLSDDATVLASSASGSGVARAELTLAVRPEAVSALLSASTAGDLRLVLPADDVTDFESGGATAPANVPAEGDGAEQTE